MKLNGVLLSVVKLLCVMFFLTGCGGIGGFSLGNIFAGCTTAQASEATLTISPSTVPVPAGTSVMLSSTGGSAVTSQPVWLFSAIAGTSSSLGTLSPTGTASGTVTYTAPATPPIYTEQFASQGTVSVVANATNNVGCFASSTATATLVITAPTVTVGVTPATASVALGTTAVFHGYAVGNVNGALTWQINGVTNGSPTYGTIAVATAGGITYTAPAAIPVTGPNVTITMASVADPTKTATVVVTLH